MKYLVSFLLLFCGLSAFSQADTIFVLGAEFGATTEPTDSTFTVDIIHPTDQLGQAFTASKIQVGYRLIDVFGRLYRVKSVDATGIGSSTLTVVELQDAAGPSGTGLVYRKPDNSDCIPEIQTGDIGISYALAARIANHNAVVGCGGTGSGGAYAFTSTAPDTALLWIDATTYDSTGVFEVKDYFDTWKTVAWYDSVGKVFSPQPPIYGIVTGQSNATPRSSGGNNTPSPYTSWWDAGLGRWAPITLPAAWTTGAGNAWWGINFGQEAAEVDKRIVKLIYVARGGRPISGWLEGQLEWNEITNRVDSSSIPRIDLVMWYQGESDYDRVTSDYADDWNAVYSQFKAFPEWTDEAQILVAQLNTEEPYNLQNGFFNTLAVDTIPNTKVVKNTDTDRADSQHINAAGYETLGKRMYQTYSGRVDHQPIVQRYDVNPDTLIDFSLITSIVIPDADTIVAARNFVNGWSGNLKIEDADSSGVAFQFPVVAYAHEGQENITAIYGRFATSCFVDNDTLFLAKMPNYYLSQNTPFTPYDLDVLPHWFRTDTIGSVFQTSGKVDSLHNFGSDYRALIPASGTAPDTVGNINGVNAITFTPTDWLEIDTTGTGSSGIPLGIYDLYMVIETSDAKGALMQGETTAYYYIWDTLSTAGGNAMQVGELYINDVLISETNRKEIGLSIINSDQPVIVQLRQVSYARMSDYFKIMDYGNNLSGFGTAGKFGELLISGSQFNRPVELQVTRYLREKWTAQDVNAQVFSDVGRQSFRNPGGGENTIGAAIIGAYNSSLSGTGTPVGSVTPVFVGQHYIDTTTPGSEVIWFAVGLANTNWIQLN